MAASTALNATLMAKDWESIFGNIASDSDEDIQELKYSVQAYYKSQTPKPSGSTNVTIATKEGIMVRVFNSLYLSPVQSVFKDTGNSAFKRIMEAIRLMNNAADNYITNQITAKMGNIDDIHDAHRKVGRKIIMMKDFDDV